MNIFRLVADLVHLASICILLLKIMTSHSANGISFKTQALYAVVFCTRYLDLFIYFVSLYNTVMKILFISTSFYILYLMQYRYRATWQSSLDTFRVEYLLVPCAVLSLLWNHGYTILRILWCFSIYLEAVAILPQLFQMSRSGEAETITSHYIFALGAYRALYILNWIYRFFVENHFDPIAVVAGIVQTGVYCDFFYIYFTRVLKGKRFVLPA